jgi:hypothetical protein
MLTGSPPGRSLETGASASDYAASCGLSGLGVRGHRARLPALHSLPRWARHVGGVLAWLSVAEETTLAEGGCDAGHSCSSVRLIP